MQAILALEDGRVFRGKGYGAKGECSGEVVFNTSITGYQEIFTDPSYACLLYTSPDHRTGLGAVYGDGTKRVCRPLARPVS